MLTVHFKMPVYSDLSLCITIFICICVAHYNCFWYCLYYTKSRIVIIIFCTYITRTSSNHSTVSFILYTSKVTIIRNEEQN